jgi:hypothetical protein
MNPRKKKERKTYAMLRMMAAIGRGIRLRRSVLSDERRRPGRA